MNKGKRAKWATDQIAWINESIEAGEMRSFLPCQNDCKKRLFMGKTVKWNCCPFLPSFEKYLKTLKKSRWFVPRRIQTTWETFHIDIFEKNSKRRRKLFLIFFSRKLQNLNPKTVLTFMPRENSDLNLFTGTKFTEEILSGSIRDHGWNIRKENWRKRKMS